MLKFCGVVPAIVSAMFIPSEANAGPTFDDCGKLANYALGPGSSEPSKNFIEIFGAPLSDWSDSDLQSFIDKMMSCKEADQNFQKSYSKRWFMDRGIGPVKTAADGFKKARTEQLAQISFDKAAAPLLAEAKPLMEKAHNLSASPAEIARLEQIGKDAGNIPAGPYPGAVKADVGQKLWRDADAAVRKYKAGIEGRENIAREAKQREANAKSDAQAMSLRMLLTYAIVDYCAEQKASITRAEADTLKQGIKADLDALSVSQDLRDKYWNAGQSGLQMGGIAQQPRYRLEKDCNELRSTLTFANAPGFGVPAEPARKNPF